MAAQYSQQREIDKIQTPHVRIRIHVDMRRFYTFVSMSTTTRVACGSDNDFPKVRPYMALWSSTIAAVMTMVSKCIRVNLPSTASAAI